MASNNPITETMKAQVLAPAALNTYGSVPGAIVVPHASFGSNVPLAANAPGTTLSYKFDIRDIPNIKQVGLFSSIADGLAPQALPPLEEPTFAITWRAYQDDAVLGSIATAQFSIINLNTYDDYDLFKLFSSDQALTSLRDYIAQGANNTRLDVQMDVVDWTLYGYSMDSAWNAASFALTVQAIVQHTFLTSP